YEYLDRWVLAALKEHGVDAWYVPINDITSTGGKIGGAAQKRRGGAVLHHVTMSYDIDADMMTQVLRIGKVKISDKGLRSAKKRVDPLRRQTGASREQLIDTLKSVFFSRYGAEEVELSDSDLHAAKTLVDEKYATEGWTKRVPYLLIRRLAERPMALRLCLNCWLEVIGYIFSARRRASDWFSSMWLVVSGPPGSTGSYRSVIVHAEPTEACFTV